MSAITIGPKSKIGFVCSGGATKAGAFHLGVALALREKGFRFRGGLRSDPQKAPSPRDISIYVGSSAGSVVTSYFAAGYSLENIVRSFVGGDPLPGEELAPKALPKLSYKAMLRFRPQIAKEQLRSLLNVRRILTDLWDGNFEAVFQAHWFKISGIFSTAGIEEFMREDVMPSNRFQDFAPELYIVTTPLDFPKKIVFGPRELSSGSVVATDYRTDLGISQACAASTSLPFIYSPYPIPSLEAGKQPIYCIDGEVRDTLSSHVAFDAGADLVFASYTHQPYQWNSAVGSLVDHGFPRIIIQSIYLMIEQKIRNFISSKETKTKAMDAVSKYCLESGVPREHREKIMEILERELKHTRSGDVIYIHPNPEDSALFLGEHFSLKADRLQSIVRSGFRAGARTLARYSFQF